MLRLLLWIIELYVCFHRQTIHRRGPASAKPEDRKMGRECLRCGRWFPLGLSRSALAEQLDRQQERARSPKRTRRPRKVSSSSPIPFSTNPSAAAGPKKSNAKDGTYS